MMMRDYRQVFIKEGERLDDLTWGDLKIIQNPQAPCFSIDSVLLTGFVMDLEFSLAADLGTGTGVIPLLLSSRNPEARFIAVEIMPQMAEMAERSVKLNGLEERISVINGDIKNCGELMVKNTFDLVTVNPPYQRPGACRISDDPVKAAYQCEIHCTLADIVREGARLLKTDGSLAMIHKTGRLAEILSLMEQNRLGIKRLRFVYALPDKDAEFFLIEGKKGYKGTPAVLPPLVVYKRQKEYTEEIMKLFGGREA